MRAKLRLLNERGHHRSPDILFLRRPANDRGGGRELAADWFLILRFFLYRSMRLFHLMPKKNI